MKKIYLSVIAIGFSALSVNAQNGQDVNYVMPQVYTGEINHLEPPRIGSATNAYREAGDTVWFNGFEDPSDWEFIPPSMGIDPLVNGWSIGNTNNSWFSFAAMNTEGNYARFVNGDPNSDPSDVLQEEPFIFLYTGTIPDLTGVPAPQLVFEQYGARFFTHQAVQISTNGGTDWQTVGSNDNIPALTAAGGSAYANTQTRSFLLTTYIEDDPSNIMLRFIWESGINGGNPNFIDYAWFVDNVRIVEGFDNDVILTNIQYGKYDLDSPEPEDQLWNDLEYGIYDINQVRPLKLSGTIFNNGAIEQTNVQLEVTVSNGGGVIETVSSDPGTIPPGQEGLFELEYTPPAEVGNYTLAYNAVIQNEDQNPANNTDEVSFQIADGVFARDNGEIANLASIVLEDGASAGAGVGYYFTDDAEVHCIGALIGEGSFSGVEFTGNVHELAAGFPSLASTSSRLVADAAINAGDEEDPIFTWLWLLEFDPFTGNEEVTPFNVSTDDEWAFSIQWTPIAIGGDPENIGGLFIGNASNTALSDGAGFVWGPQTTTGTICDPCGGNVFNTYMVRLGMSQEFCQSVVINVGLDEIANVEVQELFPNPTDGQTTLSYALLEAADVQIFLFDIQGRIVMNQGLGTQGVGEYRYNYDWSDQAAGMYTLSIHVNGKAVNKKLVIK